MKKPAEILIKKMGEDKAFAEKILSQTEREKVIEIAKDEGIELTTEDIDEVNEAVSKALQAKKEGELSEEELENVAGGSLILSAVSIATAASVASVTIVTVSMGIVSGVTLETAREQMSKRETNNSKHFQ